MDSLCPDAVCVECKKFEQHVQAIESPVLLKVMRRQIIDRGCRTKATRLERAATCVANRVVFTPLFFVVCNMLAFVPVLWPSDTVFKVVNWVSSNWWQLVLLPLIGIASKMQERQNDFRDERQYRILLISERLDELGKKER